MADISISKFKAQLPGGGARANLFEVIVNFPGVATNSAAQSAAPFLIKAAALPASVIGNIEVNYRGRKIQLAGDRSFEAWTITVINDTNFLIRNAFENWSNAINNYVTNTGEATWTNYVADMEVSQLDRQGEKVKSYLIQECWPTNISAIDVGNDNENAIEEFTVELQMLQFRPLN
jgi:hypothetical protein